jgi:hypothetical protein
LSTALINTDYLFVTTDFWQHHDDTRETQQLRNIVQAIRDLPTSITGVVVSTLEADCPDTSYPDSFIGKFNGQRYFIEAGIPVAFVYPTFWWDDIITKFPLYQVVPDSDNFEWSFPLAGCHGLAGTSLTDFGTIVTTVFSNFNRYRGQHLRICGEINYVDEIRWYLQDTLRRLCYPEATVTLTTLSEKSLESNTSNELGKIFTYYQTVPAKLRRNSEVSRLIYAKTQCFYEWLQQHTDQIISDFQLVHSDIPTTF